MLVSFTNILQFSLLVSVAGLLFFYLFFYKKLASYKPVTNNSTPPVSVIICAKNELHNLKLFLSQTLNQIYPDYEVIVVLDHCSDGSKQYLDQIAQSNLNLKVISFEKEKVSGGKKEALAYGISKASNEHLLMTDADCYPTSSDWIVNMVKGFSNNNELVLGIGTYDPGKNKLLSKVIQWDSIIIAVQYLSYSLRGMTYMSVGRNVAYTKKLFSSVNGFNSHLTISSGDDDLFVQEAHSKTTSSIVINPDSHTRSVSSQSWRAFINQKARHFSTSSKYSVYVLVLLALYQLFTLTYYTSLTLALFTDSSNILLLTMFLIKNFVQASVFRRIFFKIGVQVQLIPFLFFDIIWVLLLTVVNLKRILSPSSKW